MDGLTVVDLLSRWTHVGAAIVLVGGSVFMRYILMPAASQLPGSEPDELRSRIRARWKTFVMAGIALLLVSGFYNFFRAIPSHRGDGLYHGLMGVKILLAFAAFFLASALTGRAAAFAGIRSQPAKWLSALILISALVVGLGGALKVLAKPKLSDNPSTALWLQPSTELPPA